MICSGESPVCHRVFRQHVRGRTEEGRYITPPEAQLHISGSPRRHGRPSHERVPHLHDHLKSQTRQRVIRGPGPTTYQISFGGTFHQKMTQISTHFTVHQC